MIRTAKIIDENQMTNDFVGVGLKVKIKDMDSGEDMEFTIVGSTEADPFAGRISNESLVGQHLLGKKKGEIAEIVVPDGVLHYKIVDITRSILPVVIVCRIYFLFLYKDKNIVTTSNIISIIPKYLSGVIPFSLQRTLIE